jgi:hypothetical protein
MPTTGQCFPRSDEKDVHSKGQLCLISLLKVNYRVTVNGNLESSVIGMERMRKAMKKLCI